MASQTWPPFSPRLIILLYNPNGGSGVPPIFYRGPRGPSPAVAGSPPARRRVPAACGGVPPIICRGPRGPLPTIGGSPQGPHCMWWGSPHYLQGSPGTLANCRGVPAGSPLHAVGFPPYLQGSPGTFANCRGVPAGSPLHVVGFPPLGSPLGLSGENSSQSDQTGNYFS